MAGSGNWGHVSSGGSRGSCWGIALRFTGKWSQVIARSEYFAPGEARSQAQTILLAALNTVQDASLVAAHPDFSTGVANATFLK